MRFVKQYGARATGTNLMRLLIQRNCHAVVLMHVLGDKHSPSLDFASLAAEARRTPDPASAFVRTATLSAPAATTDAASSAQREYTDGLAPALWETWQRGDMRMVIMIRNPCAWAASELRWLGMLPWPPRRQGGLPAVAEQLAASCQTFNRCYRAWFDLAESMGKDRAARVRLEDIAAAPEQTLDALVAQLGLERRSGAFAGVSGKTLPAHWDHTPLAEGPTRGLATMPLPRQVARIADAVVASTIDWALIEPLGYRKMDCRCL